MSLLDVTIGDESPEIVNVVVEIPKGSHNKYELDDKTDVSDSSFALMSDCQVFELAL